MKTFIRKPGDSVVISNVRVGDEVVVTVLASEDGRSRLAVTGPHYLEADTAEQYQESYRQRAEAEIDRASNQ